MSNVGCRISDVKSGMSVVGCRMSDVESRMSDVGCWMSDGTYKLPYNLDANKAHKCKTICK